MAFPQVESITKTASAVGTTSLSVSMPATVNAGDLLIMLASSNSFAGAYTTPSGWTEQWQYQSGGIRFACFMIDAVGTEGGGTATLASNNSVVMAVIVYRVTAWDGTLGNVDVGSVSNGTSDSPDPPSVTAGGGSADNLFIATLGCRDDDATVDAAPTSYGNLDYIVSGAGTNAGCTVGGADRELASDSDDPGVFTLSETELWAANTIVIPPSAAGGISAGMYYRTLLAGGAR